MSVSFCIPTKNRVQQLQRTIQSIVDHFQPTNISYEIIISDNGRDGPCKEMIENNFGSINVKYWNNNEDIGTDKSILKMLCASKGEYIKLQNDQWEITSAFVDSLKLILSDDYYKNYPIFFLNNNIGHINLNSRVTFVSNMNEFVLSASYFCTWLSGIFLKKEVCRELIQSDATEIGSNLVQTEVFLKSMTLSGGAIVVPNKVFSPVPVIKSTGYNVPEIFGRNYLNILRSFCEEGSLSDEVFNKEKRSVLQNHIIPFHFDINFHSQKTGFIKYLNHYYNEDYFQSFIQEIVFQASGVRMSSNDIISLFNLHSDNKIRSRNFVSISPENNKKNVQVGTGSYGNIRVHAWGTEGEHLSIGSFCSFGDEVEFFLGGNHRYSGISTYPFLVKYLGYGIVEATSKGPIIIGDDVWLGNSVKVMSGVRIGNGSVIAAGSLVSSNIPSYVVAGGNPCKVIRKRFSEEIEAEVSKMNFELLANIPPQIFPVQSFQTDITDMRPKELAKVISTISKLSLL